MCTYGLYQLKYWFNTGFIMPISIQSSQNIAKCHVSTVILSQISLDCKSKQTVTQCYHEIPDAPLLKVLGKTFDMTWGCPLSDDQMTVGTHKHIKQSPTSTGILCFNRHEGCSDCKRHQVSIILVLNHYLLIF